MKKLQPTLSSNDNLTTVLHNGTKGVLFIYALYKNVMAWCNAITRAHHTILGGVLEGIFNCHSDISAEIKKINQCRLLKQQADIINDMRILGNTLNSYQYFDEGQMGISIADMQIMLFNGDLKKLKDQIKANINSQSNNDEISKASNNQLELIEKIERYHLFIRKFIVDHIDDIKELKYDDDISLVNSFFDCNLLSPQKKKFKEDFQKIFNKEYKIQPDTIIKKIILEAIKCDELKIILEAIKCDAFNPEKSCPIKKLEKGLFNIGKTIGQSVKFDLTNKDNQLKEGLELIVLTTIYAYFYLEKVVKNFVLKPFEILKLISLGFIYGVDKEIFDGEHKTGLEKLLITFQYPIDQLCFSFNKNYEAFAAINDKFEYAAGKKCPMRVLEKLISIKIEYLLCKHNSKHNSMIHELLKESNTDAGLKRDIGAYINKNNPSCWFFGVMHTINELKYQLAVTFGHYLGGNCKSFYAYLKSTSNNQQQQSIQ